MYFYFDKSKYYISAKRYPYISKEQIKRHNDFAYEVEKLTKQAVELSGEEEKHRGIAAAFIGSMLCLVVFMLFLSNTELGFVGSLLATAFIAMPVLGISYGISESLPASNDVKALESSVKEQAEYLDSQLVEFEQLKKNYAEYWLSMNGWQFEKEVAKLYEAHGYNAVVTKGSDDGGIDIFLTKNGTRLGVQCKNYHKPVAQAVIRELAGAMLHENLDGGIVIASSGYTKRAREFAENKTIKLLDINDVLRMHANTLA